MVVRRKIQVAILMFMVVLLLCGCSRFIAENNFEKGNHKKYPMGPLEPEFHEIKDRVVPRSLGADGRIYASTAGEKGSIARIIRWSGPYDPKKIESGFDFSKKIPNYSVRYVTKTQAGYVVIASCSDKVSGKILFSPSFEDGFSLVQKTGPIHKMGIHFFHGTLQAKSIGLAAEYTLNPGGKTHILWKTEDGGETWEEVLKTESVDDQRQVHFHSVTYDPYHGIVFASQGDGRNDRLWYSSDRGGTWSYIKEFYDPQELGRFDVGKGIHQPTLMIPLPDRLLLLPDTHLPPMILSLEKDTDFTEVGSREWKLSHEYSVYDGKATGQFFATAPYAHQEGEVYFIYPDAAREKFFILGSGDNGRSWHTLYGIFNDRANMNYGIVGPDRKGYMFAFTLFSNQRYLMQARSTDWI